MTVRARLTLWNVLVFAIAMASLGILVRQHVKQNLEAGIDRTLERGDRRPDRPPRQREILNKENIEKLRQRFRERNDPDTQRFGIFDARGTNIISGKHAVDPLGITGALRSPKSLYSTIGDMRCLTFRVSADRIGPGEGPFVVQITESLAPTNEAVSQFTRSLLTMIPLAALITAAGGLFLTGRALQPVRAATDAAAKIEASDLSKRLPVSGKDEFARLATTFNSMLERLEAAFDRQRRFVADASHEIKTPLTVIKANTSLALADPKLPVDVRETLTEIDHATDRTTRIVQDMLLLARSDAGQLTLKREDVPLPNLLRDLALEAPRLRVNGAAVTVEAPERLTLSADPHHLRRLLSNLLDNALRHTPSSGAVTLSARADGPFATISVADTGEGIPPEHLPHLGERFYRVDASRVRSAGGTGLGLSIARSVAEAHGGTLSVASTPGQGTTVTIVLPVG